MNLFSSLLDPIERLTSSLREAHAWYLRKLHPYYAEEPQASQFRSKQLQAVLHITPLTVIANVLNVGIVVSSFFHAGKNLWLFMWAGLVLWAASRSLKDWFSLHRKQYPAQVTEAAMTHMIHHAMLLALLWAIIPVILFSRDDPDSHLIITAIITGMIGAGAFALTSIPRAAIAHVLILGLGWEIAMLIQRDKTNWELALVLLIYAGVIISTVISTARNFGANLVAQAEIEKQKEVINLLLNDFEENASDWLWETDKFGKLRHVSNRLAESFAVSADELVGEYMVNLIESTCSRHTPEETESLEKLREFLRGITPFRDHVVNVMVAGEPRCWALTGKPLLNAHGQLTGWRGVGSDITHGHRTRIEMSRLANFDGLTGLANRYQFRSQLEMITPIADQPGKPCALLYLDLDNFKTANDLYGHDVGDQLLKIVAQRLQSRIRRGDLLARLGGDEFALISWHSTTPDTVADLASRLIMALREPVVINGQTVPIGTSIGIALAPDHGNHPEKLVKSADMALYAAKEAGRNTYAFFTAAMDKQAQHRLNIQRDLAVAIEQQQFEPYYQPLIRLRTGKVVGFETLLRWRHPTRGMIQPAEFIPVAEETGQIVAIGNWVLRQACWQAMTWPSEQRVAVNISTIQFSSPKLVDDVREILQESRLPPHRLELEITESILIQDSQAARTTLNALRQLGVRISLDDFGTGYSSLAYLRSFPLDKLKIDRSFISALGRDNDAKAIVQAIIRLAEALRLDTVAEGIEQQEQIDILRAMGCTDVQGFLLARPMPSRTIPAYLRTT